MQECRKSKDHLCSGRTLETLLKLHKATDGGSAKVVEMETKRWRDILHRKDESSQNNDNFLELVHMSKYNAVLKECTVRL